MSKRSEKRALELFPVDMQMCIDSTGEPYEADVNEPRRKYVAFGYEQAEKDTIERVVSWLIKNVDYYIGSMEVSRCLPIKYHVSCACWADLEAFMEEE